MRLRQFLALAAACVALGTVALAHAASPANVQLIAASLRLPEGRADIRVSGPDGLPLTDLKADQVRVLVDGQPLPVTALEEYLTTPELPERNVELSDGRSARLCLTAPAIFVVFDMPAPLGVERIDQARRSVEQFLGRAAAAGGCAPAVVDILAPTANEPRRPLAGLGAGPGELVEASNNLVVNTLGELQRSPVPDGKTRLYATILAGIEEAGRAAGQRGGQGIVLIVSDGADVLSSESLQVVIERAAALRVRPVIFDYSKRKDGSPLLRDLAKSVPSAVYVGAATEEQARAAFEQAGVIVPVGLYQLRFDASALPAIAAPAQVTVEVLLPDGTVSSTPLETPVEVEVEVQLQLPTLGSYLGFAVPATILFNGAVALLLGAVRWLRERGLPDNRTLR